MYSFSDIIDFSPKSVKGMVTFVVNLKLSKMQQKGNRHDLPRACEKIADILGPLVGAERLPLAQWLLLT